MNLLQKTICLLSMFVCFVANATADHRAKVFSLLDLDRPGLEQVKARLFAEKTMLILRNIQSLLKSYL